VNAALILVCGMYDGNCDHWTCIAVLFRQKV